MTWTRDEMAQEAATMIQDGQIVNLGIGIPTLIANYLGSKQNVYLHSENGLLGMGPFPYAGDEDPQIINAGKQTVTVALGGSTFDSALSFAMIRGGHIDLAFLGAMEVDVNGDIANWQVPGEKVTGMGGAMDLVAGAKNVVALMTHKDKHGHCKLVQSCSLPLTGSQCVKMVITEYGVFRIQRETQSFVIVKKAPGHSFREIAELSSNVTIQAAT